MSFDLETAAQPQGLRRVAIDPVSRVEGHGKVTLLLDEQNRVRQARLHIVEFRGFEAFIEGRPYWEVPVMVQRLCGICPVSHHLAAVKAIEAALGIQAIPPSAEALRRLMHYGQVMQSHALHFFHLSSPDLLFGLEAEAQRRHIVAVAEAHPDIARQGVAWRRYGQEVIKATSGKRIHGTGAVPGGCNRLLSVDERDALRAEAPVMLAHARRAVAVIEAMHHGAPDLYRHFGDSRASLMTLVGEDGTLDLYDGALRVCDADGGILTDQWPVSRYLDLIDEETRPWTYMKFPYLKDRDPETGWYRVGPLARIQAASRLGTPEADAARARFAAWGGGSVVHAALATHWARLIELLHAMEMIVVLLDDPALVAGELAVPMPRARQGAPDREGVGVIEAPRGTLIHHYRLGDDDLVRWCNLIVSTTHNNQAMNESVRAVARATFDGREVTEPMLNQLEVAIRAYDPCLSCATHALGRMPLQVTVVGADGLTVDTAQRDGDGRLQHLPSAALGLGEPAAWREP
jgi:NAD-reducing hydrogenase large subunit